MHLPRSLRSRFALFVALLVGLLSLVLASLIGENSSRRLREDIGAGLHEQALLMVEQLDRDMATRAGFMTVLSSLRALRQQDVHEIRNLLNRLQAQIPAMAWLGFTDPTGKVMASANGLLEGVDISQRPVYQEGRKGLFIGDVHDAVLLAKLLPNPTGEAMKFVDISLPVYDREGLLAGVLASHLSWSWAEQVRQSLLAPAEHRRHVEFFVLGHDGSVLLGPKTMLGQKLQLSLLEQSEGWGVQKWPGGQFYLTGVASSHGYQDYPGLGWRVVARQSLDEAYAPSHELMRQTLLWGSVLALLFAFLGWLGSAYVTRPLRRLARAAEHLADGRATVIPELQSPSEIARLSRAIRHLVEALTHQHNALGAMEIQAHQDPLTGLPNRAALTRYLPRASQECKALEQCLAFLYLDLDGFKPVNDQHGHAAGDELLKIVARRLRDCLREHDLVVRLGGDEFLMVLRVSCSDPAAQARHVAERALVAIGMPMELSVGEVQVGCSIGVSLWPKDAEQLEQAMKMADQALYRAKQAGRRRIEFHAEPARDSA